MKICHAFFLAAVLVGVMPTRGLGQPEMIWLRDEGIPLFYLETANVASDEDSLSRLLLNVRIPYDELQFLKFGPEKYRAEVEISFILFDKEGEQVEGKSFRRQVEAKSFDQTNSNLIYYVFRTYFDLPPGKYSLLCEVTDLDSRKTGKRKKEVELLDFGSVPLSISDFVLLQPRELSPAELTNVMSSLSEEARKDSSFFVARFEVYTRTDKPKLKIEYKLLDFRNKLVQEGKFTYRRKGNKIRFYIPFPEKSLMLGKYTLAITVNDGENKIKVNKPFRTRLAEMPITINNLDEAIEQLIYIADKKEIDRMKKAPDEQKRILFEEFWRKRDPTPGTPTNELMDEYYRRVAFSNAHFSTFQEGWKSDMGMVYIIFGPPNDVERQPYNVVANPYGGREVYAYELWYYYDLNRRFIFVDYRGFGEYRLLNPEALYWP
jgi:GWxTD domain-containing protein